MTYSVEFKPSVVKALKRIPKENQIQIIRKIKSLADDPWPAGCVKLADFPYYRVRYGNYRIIYEIQDNKLLILILKIGHRKDVYR